MVKLKPWLGCGDDVMVSEADEIVKRIIAIAAPPFDIPDEFNLKDLVETILRIQGDMAGEAAARRDAK